MITLLGENSAGGTPTTAQLQDWATTFGITHPVVADPGWGVSVPYTGYSISLPSMHQLAPDTLEIIRKNTWVSESQIQAELP